MMRYALTVFWRLLLCVFVIFSKYCEYEKLFNVVTVIFHTKLNGCVVFAAGKVAV